ncbi:MAG: hypothetical protein KJ043_16330, partial [Anaerolineae bacterium]|nr:hypothetical protein [Anaerolineae bacterium]
MNLTEHIDKWLSLSSTEEKVAYLMENPDTLMSDETEAELKRRLGSTTNPDTQRVLQEHLQIMNGFQNFVSQIRTDPINLVL